MNSSNRMIRKEERVLPVFLLVDTSGSMLGEKIGSVNVATKEMIRNFIRYGKIRVFIAGSDYI